MIKSGSSLVDNAGNTMVQIVDAVKHVEQFMSGIADASKEQELGIEKVNSAISRIDAVTRENAALVETVATSATTLERRARSLVDTMSEFNLGLANDPRVDSRLGAFVR